jgi:hypothetical protein
MSRPITTFFVRLTPFVLVSLACTAPAFAEDASPEPVVEAPADEASAEEMPADEASAEEMPVDEAPAETVEPDESPRPPVVGLRAEALLIVASRGQERLRTGSALDVGREIQLSEGDCLRLVAGESAALAFCGPARFRLGAADGRLDLTVLSGRGFLSASGTGASIVVSGLRVTAWAATVSFDASASPSFSLVSGERGDVDGHQLEPASSGATVVAQELLESGWCAPMLPPLRVALGDPQEIVGEVERARAAADSGSEEEATAESGATCVDNADSSSASNPTTDGAVIDPDMRRENRGRVRVHIAIPR